ncbi:hypothetical protein E2562_030270 [Oryza meyeriana var. granulata]|uniref:Uncharacterized protein n=1 Tax=Oryza meyeriana var. granulata TaxID=110450 RepID=A0A6G1D895_9ORYZ|nr:hypothetical protein E2562_030270 [Oryza meyeriana var. granulata]
MAVFCGALRQAELPQTGSNGSQDKAVGMVIDLTRCNWKIWLAGCIDACKMTSRCGRRFWRTDMVAKEIARGL